MMLDMFRERAAPAATLEAAKTSLHEADIRASKSLQVIASLQSDQARRTRNMLVFEGEEAALPRVASARALHQQPCLSDSPQSVNIAGYLFDLAEIIEGSFGGGDIVQKYISAHVQRRMVSPAFASVLGVLVTELVINACNRPSMPDGPSDIEICLFFPTKSEFRMEVREYGGKQCNDETVRPAGIGVSMIDAMCGRLKATYKYLTDSDGIRFLTSGAVS